MNESQALTLAPDIIEKLALNGDVSGLNAPQKVAYYKSLCARVGMDPSTQPFKLLRLSGKEVFYCDRGGAAQLNRLHNVSHTIVSREVTNDCYVVTARATSNGRHMDSLGAVPIKGLQGEALCNAYMKSETKAKRRATLDLLGLGMLDETEVGSIPGAQVAEMPALTQGPPETPQEPPGGVQTPSDTSKRAQQPVTRSVERPCATEDQRRKLIGLWELEGKDAIHSAHGYFIDCGAILPTESLSDIPIRWLPVTTKEVRELGVLIASGKAERPPWVTHDTASSRKPEAIEHQRPPLAEPATEAGKELQTELVEDWHNFPMPFGKNAGKLLGKLPKNYLFGLWANFKVETEYNGKPKKPETIAKDRKFRAILDEIGSYYEFGKAKGKADTTDPEGEYDNDEPPY